MAPARLSMWLLLVACVLGPLWLHGTAAKRAKGIRIALDMKYSLWEVDEEFLSVCLDSFVFVPDRFPWFQQQRTSASRLDTLLSALSPGILRVGGTYSSFVIFDKPQSTLNENKLVSEKYEMSREQWDSLASLSRRNGLRLLFDLNSQLMRGDTWDPSNAERLLSYSAQQGYANNTDWEIGNEPVTYPKHELVALSPEQIAVSFKLMRQLMYQYPQYAQSRLVGPDLVVFRTKKGQQIMQAYVDIAGQAVDALTFHHYYFGNSENWEDFVEPSNFDKLAASITTVKEIVERTTRRGIPLWQGESGICFSSRTNATKAFASGFLWLDKLGVSARMGINVVLRQAFTGHKAGLVDFELKPSPDYWLSVLHKRLVGRKVLDVEVQTRVKYVHAYAHCTNTRDGRYRQGAVTLFALNYHQTKSFKLTFLRRMRAETIDVYLMTSFGPAGLLSGEAALNGRKLELLDDAHLPDLNTAVQQPGRKGVVMPALSYGFFVFPSLNARGCGGRRKRKQPNIQEQ